jgi:DNA polymerase sigma
MFVRKVRAIFKKHPAYQNAHLLLFGSAANSLASPTSDLDFTLVLPPEHPINRIAKTYNLNLATLPPLGRRRGKKETEEMDDVQDLMMQLRERQKKEVYRAATLLRNAGMQHIVPIAHSRVPIVKFYDAYYKREADINFGNVIALRNTRLFEAYTKCDHRVRPLVLTVKQWAKCRAISDANGGTLNSYTYVLMLLFYLQLIGIVPPLQMICCPTLQFNPKKVKLADRQCLYCAGTLPSDVVDGYESYFYQHRLPQSTNRLPASVLLMNFFRFYAFEFDYDKHVVCPRLGKLVTRHEKQWEWQHQLLNTNNNSVKKNDWVLCVEDPFVLDRNTATSARPWAIEGIRWEFERAWRELAEGDGLKGVLTPYHEVSLRDFSHMNVYRSWKDVKESYH